MSHYLFLVNGPSLCLMPDNIIHHYFGHLSENEQLSFAKATQLPAFLENEKQLLDQEKKQLHHNHMLRDKQFTQLYEVKCLYWLLFYLMLTISLRLFTYHKKCYLY